MLGQKRALGVGMLAAVVGTTTAAVVAAVAAPVDKTATARIMAMLPVAAAVHAG